MFSVAYVLLPFSDVPPAEAIRASLARFQRGCRGDVPDDWLAFEDETRFVRRAHEARLEIRLSEGNGIQISSAANVSLAYDTILAEMRRRGLRRWRVRFADEMSLSDFAARFVRGIDRHPETGALGRWLNPLGRWDWWDVGGGFDGAITGERKPSGGAPSTISSGTHPGRAVLANMYEALTEAVGQAHAPAEDIETSRNIEIVATLLEAATAGHEHAYAGALVLPPASVEDSLRWLSTWPRKGPSRAITWLGLPADASWEEITRATYARFVDHWAAGVAFHH